MFRAFGLGTCADCGAPFCRECGAHSQYVESLADHECGWDVPGFVCTCGWATGLPMGPLVTDPSDGANWNWP